jgi:hypothetical protein
MSPLAIIPNEESSSSAVFTGVFPRYMFQNWRILLSSGCCRNCRRCGLEQVHAGERAALPETQGALQLHQLPQLLRPDHAARSGRCEYHDFFILLYGGKFSMSNQTFFTYIPCLQNATSFEGVKFNAGKIVAIKFE